MAAQRISLSCEALDGFDRAAVAILERRHPGTKWLSLRNGPVPFADPLAHQQRQQGDELFSDRKAGWKGELMTLQEVADRLHCSTKTVRRRINAGQLRASHIGRGLWEITKEDLDAYLDAVATRPRDVRPVPAAEPVQPHARRNRRQRGGNASSLSALVKDMARESP
jgi:excisionase family DNA binding protein